MQPPAFSGLEEECHGTMGWAKNSEELRRTVTDSISQCKVKGISEIPLAFVNIIPSLSIFQIFTNRTKLAMAVRRDSASRN